MSETSSAPELHSRPLEDEEWLPAIDALVSFMREAFPGALITAEYGFGCRIHADLTYVAMRIGVGRADKFFQRSIEQRIFLPGSSDLYVHAPDRQLRIMFCHEGDMHVAARDSSLLERFLGTAPFTQFGFKTPDKSTRQIAPNADA